MLIALQCREADAVAGTGGNHMKAMTSRALKAILAVSLGAISTAAFAQADYPTRPIKLIVPFTASRAPPPSSTSPTTSAPAT
jgi:hypothetical protein